jgi:protein-disulfide isomerase
VAVALAVVALVAVLVVALWPDSGDSSGQPGAAAPPNANADRSGIIANPDAPGDHLLAIYQDYQCPVCAYADQILGSVVAQAVATNQIRVEFRTLVFLDRVNAEGETYQSSTRAANAAACADAAGVFFAFDQYLMANQPEEGVGYTDQYLTETVPAAIGLSDGALADFQRCYAEQTYAGFVQGVAQAAYDAGFNSTPTYVLDGQTLNLSTAEALSQDIAAVLAGQDPPGAAAPTTTAPACVPSDPPGPAPEPRPSHASPDGRGIVANPDAPGDHVLAIYTDYQCPYCAQAEQLTGDVVAQAATDNKVRIELRTMTFLDSVNQADATAQSSTRAANAAACADDAGVFLAYFRYIMEHQPTEGVGYTDQYLTETVPAAIGLSGEALTTMQQCYSQRTYAAFVDYVDSLTTTYDCVTGTPTYLLDGQSVAWNDPTALQAALDAIG